MKGAHAFLLRLQWYPDIAGRIKITLIEALPNVLPMFSKQLMCVSKPRRAATNAALTSLFAQ